MVEGSSLSFAGDTWALPVWQAKTDKNGVFSNITNSFINASRLGDKCDRSMTLGKLLGNNAPLFIFIS